jgi:hypothetical protein
MILNFLAALRRTERPSILDGRTSADSLLLVRQRQSGAVDASLPVCRRLTARDGRGGGGATTVRTMEDRRCLKKGDSMRGVDFLTLDAIATF